MGIEQIRSRGLRPVLVVVFVTLSSVFADSRTFYRDPPTAGESGTGIRLFAPDIHREAPRTCSVILESFTGVRRGRSVELEWTTTREVGNRGFEVQRASSASRGWELLSFVSGIGQSSMEQRYMFDDRDAPPEDLRYMLRVLGADGTIQYSQIITVPAGSVLRSFIITGPSPSYGKLFEAQIELANAALVTVHVLDHMDNVLFRTLSAAPLKKGVNTIPLDCSKLPAGTYTVIAYTPHARYTRSLTIK